VFAYPCVYLPAVYMAHLAGDFRGSDPERILSKN